MRNFYKAVYLLFTLVILTIVGTSNVSAQCTPTVNNAIVCNPWGGNASITVSPAFGSYNWSLQPWNTSAQTITQYFGSSDFGRVYTVTVSGGPCGGATATATGIVQYQPAAPTTYGATRCPGGSTSATIGVNENFSSYLWNNGATTKDINVTISGNQTYTVTVTNAGGCTAVTTASVRDWSCLQLAITANNDQFCPVVSGPTNLNAQPSTGCNYSNSISYAWSGPNIPSGSNGQTITPNPWVPGLYTVTVTYLDPGCVLTASFSSSRGNSAYLQSVDVIENPDPCFSTPATVNLNIAGSTPIITWSDGGTGANRVINNPGTYTVTVANDGNLTTCTGIQTYSFTLTNQSPTVGIASTNVTCNGGSNGTATVTGSAGTPPYSFLWNTIPSQSSATASGLSAGTYTVTVTGSNSCSTTTSVTITQPSPFTASIVHNAPICAGQSLNVAATGGTNYSWSGPNSFTNSNQSFLINNATVTNAGVYTVTVTNSVGCTNVLTSSIIVNALPTASVSANSPICEGQTLSLTATGGTGYSWSGPGGFSGSGTPLNRLSATTAMNGNYIVTVTNTNGCTSTSNVVVNINPLPVVTATSNAPICIGQNLNLSTIVGNSYSWSGPNSFSSTIRNPSISNVSISNAGIYTVTVTSSNGCSGTSFLNVTFNALPTPSIGANTPICQGQSLNLTSAGGTSYAWQGPAGFTNGSQNPTISNAQTIASGTYTVTVTNGTGCSSSTTIAVTINPLPTITLSSSGNICNGSDLQLFASGGSSYVWSGPSSFSSTLQNPIRTYSSGITGTYTVTVTSSTSCSSTSSLTVNEFSLIITQIGTRCQGVNNVVLDLEVTGGNSPYTYLWNTGQTTQDIPDSGTGTYTVTVTDSNPCTATSSINVVPDQPVVITANSIIGSCPGFSNGAIDINVTSPGTSSFTYVWSSGQTTQDINLLAPGVYTVTATKPNSCFGFATFTVPTLAIPNPVLTSNTPICVGQTINLTSGGGTGYSWSGPSSFTSTTQNPTRTGATTAMSGTYTVTVTNAAGCTATATTAVVVTNPPSSTISPTNVLCFGNSTGAANLTVNGGTTAYTYLWSNGVTTEDLSNISAGTYTVTVTDGNSCTTTATVTITQPASALAASITGTNVLCFGNSTGAANLTVNGGTTAYTYLWSNGSTNEDLTNISAGTYTVTVTDGNSCTTTASVTITQPASALAASITGTNVLCFGNSTGAANLTVSGGTTTYTYLWSNGSTNEDLSNISAGTYTATITDANNCQTITSITITQPASALAASITGTNVLCFGNTTGAANLTVNGGTTAYTYAWSNGSTNEDLTNIAAGTYTATVTDGNSCTTIGRATINQPTALTATVIATPASCNTISNGTINSVVIGGSNPYSYAWSNGATMSNIINLIAGTYTLTVTDANGCVDISSTIINIVPNINVTINDNFTCFDTQNSLTVNQIFESYSWSNNATTQSINVEPGVYTVTVRDNFGCTLSTTGVLREYPQILISSTNINEVSCFGLNDGSIEHTVSGGSTPYRFDWSNGGTSSVNSNLFAGTYSVTVTDINGCRTQTSVPLTTVPFSSLTLNDKFTCSQKTALLNVEETFSNYQWSNGISNRQSIDVRRGLYTVTVTDNNGCTSSTQANVLEYNIPNPTIISNNNCTNNELTLSQTYVQYQWSNGETSSSIFAGNGQYFVTVTDANGCTAVTSDNISIQNPPLVSFIVNESSCGENNGIVNVSVSGSAPFRYDWSNDGIGDFDDNQDQTNLVSGLYFLTVLDVNGCSTTTRISVNAENAFEIQLSKDAEITCKQKSTMLSINGPNGSYDYSWKDSQGNLLVTGKKFVATLPGSYIAEVVNSNGCIVNDTVIVYNNFTPPTFEILTEDETCFGKKNGHIFIKTSTRGNLFSINNSPYINENLFDGLNSGLYEISIMNDYTGCKADTSVKIGSGVSPTLDIYDQMGITQLSDNFYEINAGDEVKFQALPFGGTRPYEYLWMIDTREDFGCVDCNEISFTPNQSFNIYAEIVDANGCLAESFLHVDVVGDNQVYIPNAFTPNGDGNNDKFNIHVGFGVKKINSFMVFDRWGEVVFDGGSFEVNGNTVEIEGWDGSFKGKGMNANVFVFFVEIEYANGKKGIYKGDLTLIR